MDFAKFKDGQVHFTNQEDKPMRKKKLFNYTAYLSMFLQYRVGMQIHIIQGH